MEKIVIVLGNTITALGTLRACAPLKKRGFALWLASTTRKDNIAISSNIPDKKITFENGLVQGLRDLAKDLNVDTILLFTRDDEVVEVSKHHEELRRFYRFLLPEPSVVDTLMEKVKFSQFAENEKLPVPKTEYVRDEESLLSIDSRIPFPIIIKPYLMHAVKAGDREELQSLVKRFAQVNYSSMVAQEYIEGADDQLYFCFLLFDEGGQLVRSMYARKLRQWPVSYGTTSLAITMENPGLASAVEQFRKTVRISGFCSIEFKYDARNDRYLIMEPTIGRFNQQIALSVACGVNFPMAVVQLLAGEKLEEATQKNGVRWIYESNDLMSFLRAGSRHGYFGNFFKPHVSVLFASNDPNPFFHEVRDMMRKKINKIFRHV